ncbi:MAG: hypothetical protein WC825_08535 [Gallionellaceae bacterium]|jgi:hypothetical protein
MNCKMKCWKIGVLVVLGVAALGWVVMALWNWLLPNLFAGVGEIDYVQAMGVLLLSKILFGGFRGHCGGHSKWHQQRWEKMTPEEREKFQTGMRGCCGSSKPEEGAAKE